MGSVTTIQIHNETRNLLRNIGHKAETYDELINRLIITAQKVSFFNEIDRIVKTEEFVSLDDI